MSLAHLDYTIEKLAKEIAARNKHDLHYAFLRFAQTPEGQHLWSAFNRTDS
ncbi:MAG: hypothetical protein M3120_01375 [Pseudomonadota bacterium]|nr:hypothetical protein [Pseudomonadota bacterium]